ncbi:MAG: SIR2 family protein, partial [Promethearchaeia archaeon]
MKSTNLKISDLITSDAKLTFLVGAGCSVDPPSCLPTGEKMMKAIIEYTCAESEIQKIFDLEELRFEQLIEIVRDRLDEDLKIIDYYGQCKIPNMQHFFLAEMMKNGHFVLTTNFDFLIEYALQETGVSKEQIVPVITRDDFEKSQDPYELFELGKNSLYKVHGSTKNIITDDSTRDSLIATIKAFGTNKEGLNVCQLE